MPDCARRAREAGAGKSEQDLERDDLLAYALLHLIQTIGEASRRVSEETREQHSEIAWAAIAGMRNRIVHGYDDIDLRVVVDVVKFDLTPLIDQLESILRS
jgi:uncharacterized protein with HEPN domain